MTSVQPRTAGASLYVGAVTHLRTHVARHGFRYPLYMHLFDLTRLDAINGTSRLLGYNRRRPVGLHDADHLDGAPLLPAVRAVIERHGGRWPGGRVLLLTHPRLFGYVFNPISLFYCFDRDDALDTVVAEVSNTFGERHVYVLDAPASGSRGNGTLTWDEKKVFHVSPFLEMDGTYRFALAPPGEAVEVDIDLEVAGQRRLATRLRLKRRPLTDGSLALMLLRYPLMTFRVIAAIHWEALRLWWKGVKYLPKPPYAPETARRTQP